MNGGARAPMTGPELRHVRTLLAVADERSFTDAAIRLGVSQPAVSRSIRALEQIVGARLVERTTRAVTLTDAGRRCYPAAVAALAAVEDLIAAARGRTQSLRLGYAWSALGRYTTDVLRRWRQEQTVPLEVHRIDDTIEGLRRGAVDVVILRGDSEHPDLSNVTLFDEPRMAALAVNHPLATRTSLRLGDLASETVLLTANGTTTLELWPTDARPAASVHVDNIDEWLTEVAGGLAIGVTAQSTASQHAHPGITFVPVLDAPLVAVQLGWPTDRVHPAVEPFLRLVERVIAER